MLSYTASPRSATADTSANRTQIAKPIGVVICFFTYAEQPLLAPDHAVSVHPRALSATYSYCVAIAKAC